MSDRSRRFPSSISVSFRHRAVQQLGDLGVDSATAHVAVLSHRQLDVAEVVGPDSRRQPTYGNPLARIGYSCRPKTGSPELLAIPATTGAIAIQRTKKLEHCYVSEPLKTANAYRVIPPDS
jgi:hypothetical protein